MGNDAFFCDYVIHTLLLDPQLGATAQDRAKLLATGGLKIYTTVNKRDQTAATNAVNYVLPAHSKTYNPARNAASEVLIQPGTGKILAIAEDRPYGTGPGQTEVDYAVNTQYGGVDGVQTGSSSKLFTLITALEQGVPFGFQPTVPGNDSISRLLPTAPATRPACSTCRTPRAPARPPTRCTPAPRSRSTSSTPSLSRRSACATW